MTQKSHILFLLAVGALMPLAPAHAADYDPPIFVEEAAEFVPVEVGSGWYLRGDLAYNLNEESTDVDFGLTPVSFSEDENPIFASIGFGYHFNDYLRADINFGYLPGNEISASYDDGVIAASGRLSNHAWTGMLNGYVDLGTYVGLTPYVGAGIGVYRSTRELEASFNDGLVDLEFRDDETQYSMAYSLAAGVGYNVSKNLVVDLGYQYLSAPDAEYVSVDDLTEYPIQEGLDYHQVKVGLRYELW
jgi:opacity protein-like surface antigen